MKIIQKRCLNCGRCFQSDPRIRLQKFCGHKPCQRARRRRKLRRWRMLHPDRAKHYQPKARAWAKAYPNYWRHYRATHREYVTRDKHRRVSARRKARLSANETVMPEIVVEKLQALDTANPRDVSAKETPILRRMDAIEDCLRSTVTALWSAKRTPIDLKAASAR